MSKEREINLDNSTNSPEKTDEAGVTMQDKMADEVSSTSRNQTVIEPCRTPIERSLLAHFFFIFAASFILGVIFLHSSLRFWSWQVNDINEYGPYGGQYEPPSETFLYQQNSQQHPSNAQEFGDSVLTIILRPNMTLALTR